MSTPGGKWLDDLKLFNNGIKGILEEDAYLIRRRTSERYAENALGTTIGILNNPRIDSIFNTIEFPTLKINPKVTNVITGGK